MTTETRAVHAGLRLTTTLAANLLSLRSVSRNNLLREAALPCTGQAGRRVPPGQG